MRRPILVSLPLYLAMATLAGCGNKGPLVLPPPKPTSAAKPATVTPASKPAAAASAPKPAAPAIISTTATPATDSSVLEPEDQL